MGRPNGTMGIDRVGGVCEPKGGKEKIRWDFFFFWKEKPERKRGPSEEPEGKHLEGWRFRYPSFDYVHSSSQHYLNIYEILYGHLMVFAGGFHLFL